jgi:hypothetical protein
VLGSWASGTLSRLRKECRLAWKAVRKWSGSRGTVSWTENVVVSGQLSKASPALAAFDGGLHMVHLGDSSNRLEAARHEALGVRAAAAYAARGLPEREANRGAGEVSDHHARVSKTVDGRKVVRGFESLPLRF